MDRIKAMQVFIAVAEKQGFAAAARHLDMSTSAVSRHVVNLENLLGVQLLHRTTRSINLTDAGASYLLRCTKVMRDLDALESGTQHRDAVPSGEIKVTASVFLAKNLLRPVIQQFLEQFRDTKINLLLVDRTVDLIDEGIDVAVRVGRLPDASYKARKLDHYKMAMVASPRYLEANGTPRSIKDLDNHNCLVDRVPHFGNRWPLAGTSGRVSKRVSGNFVAILGEIVRDLAIEGLGIVFLPDFFVQADIEAKRLTQILEKSVSRTGDISAVYAPTKYAATRTRAFIDFLVDNWPRQNY